MSGSLPIIPDAHQILTQQKNLEAIFNSLSDGILVLDNDLKITHANKAAERITGFSANEVLGQSCTDILQGNLCGTECFMAETWDQQHERDEIQVEMIRKDGEQRTLQLKTSLLHDPEGKAIGVVVVFRDLTELDRLKEELKERYRFHNIIGKSHPMLKVYNLIRQLAPLDTTVLIEGETGAGKELVARAIHYQSPRTDKPLVKVNCSVLSVSILESELFGHVKGSFTGALYDKRGRFEEADGGTIFLDEIGDISPLIQSKLFRVLEHKEFERVGENRLRKVDIRIITATNRDLKELVQKGQFREDLYYRLKVVPIHLPPLRERREDIPLLVSHFIDRFNQKMGRHIQGVSKEAIAAILNYEWPGNVRELEHAIEYAFAVCNGDQIAFYDLPPEVSRLAGRPVIKDDTGIETAPQDQTIRLREALKRAKGNHSEAARLLGISRATLWRKLKAQHLIPPETPETGEAPRSVS